MKKSKSFKSLLLSDYDSPSVEIVKLNTNAGLCVENEATLKFPAAGFSKGTSRRYKDSYGYWWSSSYRDPTYAYSLSFSSIAVTIGPDGFNTRSHGQSIRPVSD